MRRTLLLALVAALAFSGTAQARPIRPPIVKDYVQWVRTAAWRFEDRNYNELLYHVRTNRLRPKGAVIHYTQGCEVQVCLDSWAQRNPIVNDGGPQNGRRVVTHFIIARNGTIRQLMPLWMTSRGTMGVDLTHFSIEQVGWDDNDVLNNPRLMRSSLALVCWLKWRYRLREVTGHNESTFRSRYYTMHDRKFWHVTHADFPHADMVRYRARLKRACP